MLTANTDDSKRDVAALSDCIEPKGTATAPLLAVLVIIYHCIIEMI